MEMMRTESACFKYVIIVFRDGRERYVSKYYNPKMCGCTVKINEAMRYDRPENAQKAMDRYGFKGRIGKIKIQVELVEDDATEQ